MQYYKPQAAGSMGVGRGPVGGSSSNDLTNPIIQNITPADGSEQQDYTTPITFDIFDYGDNINRSTILVVVNGEMVLSGDTFHLGWTGSVTKQDFGYHVHLNPNFTGRGRKVVEIDANVKDETGLLVCAEWSYVTYVIPNTLQVFGLSGPLDGGTLVEIYGSGMSVRKYMSNFGRVGLGQNWTGYDTADSTSGMLLATSSMTSPRIESLFGSNRFDVSITYSTNLYPSRSFHGSSVVCAFKAKINDGTYCEVSNVFDETGFRSYAMVYNAGRLMSSAISDAKSSTRLTIRRNLGHIEMYSGEAKLVSMDGWSDAHATFVVYSSTTNVPFTTTIKEFVPSVVVLFDNEMADSVTEYDSSLLIARSPRYKFPVNVPMSMYSFTSSRTLPYGFTYIEPPRLNVSNSGAALKIQNDTTLRDASDSMPGLRT